MNHSKSVSCDNLVLLFGAGASVEAGIPHVVGFVNQFEEWLKKHYGAQHSVTACYHSIKRGWAASSKKEGILHLERLFELLHFINGLSSSDPIPRILPPTFPERCRATELLYWDLMRFVHAHCTNVEASRLRYLYPLAALARKYPKLTIITLNYDACVERVLDARKVHWSDGFSASSEHPLPSFSLRGKGRPEVRLLKLHGSVSWFKKNSGIIRIVESSEEQVARTFNRAQSMVNHSTMIFPVMNKGLAHGPFPALFVEAQQALARASLCVAIGYGFNDQHIRQMVVDGLKVNEKLRIALVNPNPEAPLQLLYEEAASIELQKRIGFIALGTGSETRNFLSNALQRGRLSKSVSGLLSGKAKLCVTDRFAPRSKPASPLPVKGKLVEKPWRLRFPLSERTGRMLLAGRQLKVITGDAIHSIDIITGERWLVSDEFQKPVCMAYDPTLDRLYVAENEYRPHGIERVPLSVFRRLGLGRLWMKCGDQPAIPISGLQLTEAKLSKFEHALHRDIDYLHKLKNYLRGVLRFPTEILIEKNERKSLFIAQAGSGIWRFGLVDRKYEKTIEVPECMNLVAVHRYSANMALLVDGGVHPNGYGRLMKCNLETKRIQVCAGGWSQIGGIAIDKSRGLILISQGYSWPSGRVFALDLRQPQKPIICEWKGLHHPRSLIVDELTNRVFASARDGIYELEFS